MGYLKDIYAKLGLSPKAGDRIEFGDSLQVRTILDAHDNYIKLAGVWKEFDSYQVEDLKGLFVDGKLVYSEHSGEIHKIKERLGVSLLNFREGAFAGHVNIIADIEALIDAKIKESDERIIL